MTTALNNPPSEAEHAGRAALHALEMLGEAAVLTDLSGTVLRVTGAYSALFNSSASELQFDDLSGMMRGMAEELLLSADACDAIRDGIEEPCHEFSGGKPLRVTTQKGSCRWVIPHVVNIEGPQGRPVAKLFILRDVSAQKQVQIASTESERKYRQLVDQANTIILQVDSDFTIRFANEYASVFFGYTDGELTGRKLQETLLPARGPTGEELHTKIREVMESPELYGVYDQLARCKEGFWVWVHWSARAIRDAQGEVCSLLCIGTDITQRKQAEILAERYRRQSRRLTDQLICTEEKERTRMAEYLHDEVIQMLSLANIRMGGVLDGIREADLDDEAKRLEDTRSLIEEAARECRSMMEDLVPSLLHELGIGEALTHLVEKHHLTDGIKVRIDNHIKGISMPRGTANLLFQSTRELLMNALKYAGPCEVVISLNAEEDKIYIQVEDNGRGFDIRCLEKCLYANDGGFGLFNIRERLEGLGGQLHVESVQGQGTTASVFVPLPDQIDGAESPARP
jgi:PAS domain S-box-containing protein